MNRVNQIVKINNDEKQIYTPENVVPNFDEVLAQSYVPSAICKVCTSIYRHDIDEFYDKSRNQRKTWEFAKSKEPDKFINVSAVREHIINHLLNAENKNLMKGYAKDVANWMNHTQTKEIMLKRNMAMLEREMHILESQNEGVSIDDRRKTAETIRKLSETLLLYQDKLSEISSEKAPTQVILQQISLIFNDKIRTIENPAVKQIVGQAYTDILDGINKELGDMVISEEVK